jgi:LmbE family N-acetylglucosaminyl deacetylase
MAKLMVVFAHPDDESFGTVGTVRNCVEAGHKCLLYCGTYGNKGRHGRDKYPSDEELGAARAKELQCAARTIGYHQLIHDNLGDKLLETPEVFPKLVSRVRSIADEFRPDVILTFGEDGVYGHPDHVAVWRASRQVYEECPFVKKLYCVGVPKSAFVGTAREGIGVDDHLITTFVSHNHADIKRQALECHKTQRTLWEPFVQNRPEILHRPESFVLFAHRLNQPPDESVGDLFAGILQ